MQYGYDRDVDLLTKMKYCVHYEMDTFPIMKYPSSRRYSGYLIIFYVCHPSPNGSSTYGSCGWSSIHSSKCEMVVVDAWSFIFWCVAWNKTYVYLLFMPCPAVEFLHVKPGKGAAFVRTKMRNYITGNTVDKTFRAGTTVTFLFS